MRKTCLCLMAWCLITQAARAEDSKSLSFQQAARRLLNAANVSQTPITWDVLVFSGDGKTLAGAGDRPNGRPVSSGLPGVPPKFDRAALLEVWDLKTYRPAKAAYTSLLPARYAAPGTHLRVALRISENGRTLYGNHQTNDFNADILHKLDTGGQFDARAYFGENTGIYLWDLGQEHPTLIRATEAPTSVFFLGSHLPQDGRHVLLATPEGLQNHTIQVQQQVKQPTKQTKQQSKQPPQKQASAGKRKPPSKQTPKSNAAQQPKEKKQLPGARKEKRLVAKAQGEKAAAPTKFQTPSFFSPNGSCFVAAEEDGGMVVWDVKEKKLRCRTAAPAEGRAAVAAVSRDGRRLFVASSSDHGSIHIYDTENGRQIGQIGPLKGQVIGLSASADGESLAYCVDGAPYIHNAAANAEIKLPFEEGDRLTCIAISGDGLSAAGGGDDGAVRLWEAAPPRQAPVAQERLEATEAPLVALGPRRVTVTGGKGETQEMWLLRLTPGMAILRKTPGGKSLRVPAANGRVTQITAADAAWRLNAKSGIYVGPALASPKQPANNAPARPASPEEENLYLLLGARRRLSAIASMIEQPGNDEPIAETRRQAELIERYLNARPAPAPTIAAVYNELTRAVDELTKSEADRRRVLETLNRQAIEMSHQRAAEVDRALANRFVGLGKMLLGSLTGNTLVSASNNPAGGYGPVYVQEVVLFPGLLRAGALQALGQDASSRQRRAQLAAARKLAEAETTKTLVAALELRESAIKRVQDRWQGVATRDFGLDADPPPPEDLPRKSRRAADLQPLVDALTEQMRRDRGRTSRDDPFQSADILFLKSLVRESAEADVENVFRLALDVAALASQVPPGDVHHADRATLLLLAATMVGRAVTLESGDGDPAEAYSEKAAYAVVLLDRALTLEQDDPAGHLGEQRALALAQCGQSEAALEQARQVVAKHPDSASARYLLARLECSAGNLNAGLDQLERALVKHGLCELNDARKRAEFPKNDDRFKDLAELKLRMLAEIGVTGRGRVTVYNGGKFPLHNVGFRLQYRGSKLTGKGLTSYVVETGLQRLAPRESYVIFTDPRVEIEVKPTKDGKRKRWSGGKLAVTTPLQGMEEFTLESASISSVEGLLTPAKR